MTGKIGSIKADFHSVEIFERTEFYTIKVYHAAQHSIQIQSSMLSLKQKHRSQISQILKIAGVKFCQIFL